MPSQYGKPDFARITIELLVEVLTMYIPILDYDIGLSKNRMREYNGALFLLIMETIRGRFLPIDMSLVVGDVLDENGKWIREHEWLEVGGYVVDFTYACKKIPRNLYDIPSAIIQKIKKDTGTHFRKGFYKMEEIDTRISKTVVYQNGTMKQLGMYVCELMGV
jgi:hypothetical protein